MTTTRDPATAGVPADFAEAARRVSAARTPRELFGDDPRHTYRQLAKLLHPDRVGAAHVGQASAAFARLAELWQALRGERLVITTPRGTYRIGERVAADQVAAYFGVHGGGLLKLARRPTDNDLMERETAALAAIRASAQRKHRAYLPKSRDSFRYREADAGVERVATVFAELDGFYSLEAVRAAYPDGLDARDVVWMWRRLLVALGIAHRAGFVHGAATLDHILIHPEAHGLVLVNWCFAARLDGDAVPAIPARYRDWYAPEIMKRGKPTPGSDIYLATRCMTALMGDRAPDALRRFARGCALPSPAARPQDAWRLLGELDELLGRVYGPRVFRPFDMPAGAPAWPTNRR